MRRLIIFSVFAFACGQPQFSGRVSGALNNVLSWPLASVYANVEGTAVTANIDRVGSNDQSSYVVFLDRTRAGIISPGSSTFRTTIHPGKHEIMLVKSNEAMYGEAKFSGITVENGRIDAADVPERRIEIIGDSISAGYGILGKNAYCQAVPSDEDSTLTYGFLTGVALGAQVNLVAYSGKGLYKNYDSSMDQTLPILWRLASPIRDLFWDTTKFVPDVAVVNLGTNDFAHGTDVYQILRPHT